MGREREGLVDQSPGGYLSTALGGGGRLKVKSEHDRLMTVAKSAGV